MVHIYWFQRRNLRLSDNAGLCAAATAGAVVPVFIYDQSIAKLGAAVRWQLHQELVSLAHALAARGSRLILRQGESGQVLRDLATETGATRVFTQAHPDPRVDRWRALALGDLSLRISPGFLLGPAQQLCSGAQGGRQGGGQGYRVFTPFWRQIERMDLQFDLLDVPVLRAPDTWPTSDAVADWALQADMRRGAAVLAAHSSAGEGAAQIRLRDFARDDMAGYATGRDMMWPDRASGLSTALAFGTISAAQVWQGAPNPTFRRQLAWREFAWHLWQDFPQMESACWRKEWNGFAWQAGGAGLSDWQQARTGVDLVDAAMRALYVTGRMHNRLRMVVASYLTKNLLVDWRAGLQWFADTLVDFDRASNAMGWQWVAGCGPDAAPYFRVFNPDTQAQKFDANGAYRAYWLTGAGAAAFGAAVPRAWSLARPLQPDLKAQRNRALQVWQDWRATLGSRA